MNSLLAPGSFADRNVLLRRRLRLGLNSLGAIPWLCCPRGIAVIHKLAQTDAGDAGSGGPRGVRKAVFASKGGIGRNGRGWSEVSDPRLQGIKD